MTNPAVAWIPPDQLPRPGASGSRGSVMLEHIAAQRAELERRLADLESATNGAVEEPPVSPNLIDEVRRRLDEGLSVDQRHEIVRFLASIVFHTAVPPQGRKTLRVVMAYRFPAVGPTDTGNRERLNYTLRQRVIELPTGRQRTEPSMVRLRAGDG